MEPLNKGEEKKSGQARRTNSSSGGISTEAPTTRGEFSARNAWGQASRASYRESERTEGRTPLAGIAPASHVIGRVGGGSGLDRPSVARKLGGNLDETRDGFDTVRAGSQGGVTLFAMCFPLRFVPNASSLSLEFDDGPVRPESRRLPSEKMSQNCVEV